jgi:peroxiredoxin
LISTEDKQRAPVNNKPKTGDHFETISLPDVGGGELVLGGEGRWQLIVVYRGKHCPICKTYLKGFEALRGEFSESGIEVCAISADDKDRAVSDVEAMGITIPVGYDLSEGQMRQMGLFISDPVGDWEIQKRFPEPGVFVIKPDGTLFLADIGSAPFVRTDLKLLLGGLKYAIANDYPTRGQV